MKHKSPVHVKELTATENVMANLPKRPILGEEIPIGTTKLTKYKNSEGNPSKTVRVGVRGGVRK